GAILDFADVGGRASATLSGTEIDISSAGSVVAEVGLSAATAANIEASPGPLTLGADGSGGSELIVPSLGNDTIDRGGGPDAIAALGAATVMAGGRFGGADHLMAGSGDTTIIGGETLFRPGGAFTGGPGGPDSFGGAAGWPVKGGGLPTPSLLDPRPLLGDAAGPTDPSSLGGAVALHLTDGTMITLKGFPHLTG